MMSTTKPMSDVKTYVRYQKEREEEGHPRPLGVGVMMWDEVKVRI